MDFFSAWYEYSPIILLHTEDPPAQDIVRYVELLYKIALLKHPDGSTTRVVIGEIKIDERETIEIIYLRWWYRVRDKSQGVVVVGRCVITQAFEGHFLLRHQFACGFVHLRVVNAEAAKDSECFKYWYVRIGEGDTVVLWMNFSLVINTEYSLILITFILHT